MVDLQNPFRILIVDDTPENLDFFASVLAPYYDIKAAKTGKLALQIALNQPLDLVLLDIIMPEMDGYDVCKQLKEHEQTKSIPVILMTSKNIAQSELLGFKLGAVDYLSKPVSPAIVLSRVRTQLLLKNKMDLLQKLVSIDGLTEIPNRKAFDVMFDRQWKQAIRKKSAISLIMMDVDAFRQFNDYYGYNQGDDALTLLAKKLASAVNRPEDMVVRFAGQRFACILPATDVVGGNLIAERLIETVRSLKVAHERSTIAAYITISIGLASLRPEMSDTSAYLLELANKRLFLAKQQGGDRIVSESPEVVAKNSC